MFILLKQQCQHKNLLIDLLLEYFQCLGGKLCRGGKMLIVVRCQKNFRCDNEPAFRMAADHLQQLFEVGLVTFF